MSASTLAKMSKNQPVAPKVLLKVAKALDCEPEDICEIKLEEPKTGKKR